jgi:hypothetical protein
VKVGKIGDMDCQIVDTSSSDSDHDGIPDTEDRCTGTPPQVVVDQEGCSISDRVPPCAEYKNKGDFQSTLAHVVNEFRKACLISGEEGGKIKSRGAHFHPGEGTCTEADIDVHTTPDRQLPPGCGAMPIMPLTNIGCAIGHSSSNHRSLPIALAVLSFFLFLLGRRRYLTAAL